MVKNNKRNELPSRLKLSEPKRFKPSKSNLKRIQHQKQIEMERAKKMKQHDSKFQLEDSQPMESDAIGGFEGMEMNSKIVDAIQQGLGFTRPTDIQSVCIPAIMQSKSEAILCAAETGTGKTLVYLATMMHSLKKQEECAINHIPALPLDNDSNSSLKSLVAAVSPTHGVVASNYGLPLVRKLNRPRGIVLLPSRDLVAQVTAIAKQISHKARLRVVGVHSKSRRNAMNDSFAAGPVDLLVTTPVMLSKLIQSFGVTLSQTVRVVVDEADSLLDDNVKKDILPLLSNAKQLSDKRMETNKDSPFVQPCKFLFTTATLPKTVMGCLRDIFPQVQPITTKLLHRPPRGLNQRFVRLDRSTTKENLLVEILKSSVSVHRRVIVFCNRRETCQAVGDMLAEKGYEVVKLSSAEHQSTHSAALSKFTSDSKDSDKNSADALVVMVATDMASRGLDTTEVDHVILYDFPQNSIDYLHRVGRTARNGSKGQSTAFVTRRDYQLADSIEKAIKSRRILA